MDKYKLALLGEAGAVGLARGLRIVYGDVFQESEENEMKHLQYFRRFRRSYLERPIETALTLVAVISRLGGRGFSMFLLRKAEEGAINFYLTRFGDSDEVKWILEDERRHLRLANTF